jgi:hypothetical protein
VTALCLLVTQSGHFSTAWQRSNTGNYRQPLTVVDVVVAARAKAAATVCNTGKREPGRQSGDALVWQAKAFFREGRPVGITRGPRTRLGV